MALKGDLASVDLAQVFQMLALNKKVGLLSIQSPKLWKILYFDQRGATLYYNPHVVLERAAAALMRGGRLMPEGLAEARSQAMRNNTGLMESLLAGGYLTEADTEQALRQQIDEEIYDLFFCKDARFEFYEGASTFEGREGVVDDRFFANSDSIIMEAARRIDEWSYLTERITSPQDVFRTIAAADPANTETECLAVLDLVDGRRSVARIVDISALGTFPVHKHLYQLLEAGVIGALPDEELIEAANQCMTEGRLQDAIALYERAASLGVGLPDVHAKAADALQAAEQFEQAAAHLRSGAEVHLAAGQRGVAVARLRRAASILPTDLATRERLVELCLPGPDCPADFDPLGEGKVLVDLYLEIGDLKRVRSLLEKLLRLQPEDQDLKKALVNVHTRNGDTKRVIELYESMAEDLVRNRRPLEAVGYLQKILMLDRSRTDVSERMRALYEFDERSRSRRRCLTVLGAVFLALIGLGVAYWFYDRSSQEDFERIDVRKLVEAKDFTKAAAVYERFVQEHPLTLAVPRAEEELLRIESARKKHEAKVAQDKVARDRELARIRAEYRTDWSRYRDLFKSGDPDGSLAAVDRVRQKLRLAGEDEDMVWALEEQVEKQYVKLRDFLAEAEKLAGEARQLLEAGDWQQARKLGVELSSKYSITRAARDMPIPVEFRSRPPGARIMQGGKPVERTVNKVTEALVAPAVVLCRPAEETFTFELPGFEPCTFTVDARKQDVAEQVLKVMAERTIRFPAVVQTSVASSGNWLVAGLRDGRVGIGNAETLKVAHAVPLGGLKSVDSTPIISGNRTFFLSNEGTIECVLLQEGQLAPRWPVRLEKGAVCEPVVGDGRVLVCDRDYNLLCFDQIEGRQLWSIPLRAAPVGRPTLARRNAVIGTSDGKVYVVETISGKVLHVWNAKVGITTRVLAVDGCLYFGCSDQTVRAVEEDSGQILWSKKMGRVVADGELEVAGTNLVALAGDNLLVLMSRANNGEERAQSKLVGNMQKGILVASDRILVTVRTPKTQGRGASDALQARDLTDLSPLWDYQDTGLFHGPPTAGGRGIVLADSNGEVVLFR